MNFNRKEHSRFIQYLDRMAEKNPLLWLPCVLLIALALAAEHIVEHTKIAYLHRNTEKAVREKPQLERKPFFLRAVAVTVTAAFSLMLVPVTSFADFNEEYDPVTEQIAFDESSETEETSDLEEVTESEEPTVTEVTTTPEETLEPEEPIVTEVTTTPEETLEPEEPIVTEVTTAPESEEPPVAEGTTSQEEPADPEEEVDSDETSDQTETTAPNETTSPEETNDTDETDPTDQTDPDDHEHKFDGWERDKTGHYQECYICGYKTDVEGHDYEWDFYTSEQHCRSCNVCGEVTDIGEHFAYKWECNNADGHSGICICGVKLSSEAHHFSEGIPTLDEGNRYDPDDPHSKDDRMPVMRYYCTSHCGYYYDEPITHTHKPEEEWKHDSSGHWHECTCGIKTDIAAHDYVIKITVEPTNTSTGTRVYTCTVCGYSYNEKIPELGHTHTIGSEWYSNENTHWHICTACGEHFYASSHNDDNVADTVKPTAATAGIRTYSCSVCGYTVRTESIPPINESNPSYPVNPTPSYPTITYPANATVKEPYIYGDTPKTGWDKIISDIDLAMDGDTVRVNMNGTTELPQSAVLHIQNRNVNLELNIGSTVWNINGLDVTNPKTVNLRVSERSDIIPASVIENLRSELEPKEYRLYHSGDFGFKATLTLNLGKRYNNYYAALYHYNTKDRQLEFVDESFVENRQVTFELTHASYYAVAFNIIPMYDDVSSGAGVFESSIPIETSAMPETNGVTVPAVKLPQIMKYSNKKRRYRILRKRRLDDLIFVL